MFLGMLLFYPNVRRMVTFPISLAILAFSGAEDILYYWLDSRPIPAYLPWLESNPLILKPVTADSLLISAVFWLAVIFLGDVVGQAVQGRLRNRAENPGQGVQEFLRNLRRVVFQILTRSLRYSLAALPRSLRKQA
jgi:hypothetical protein